MTDLTTRAVRILLVEDDEDDFVLTRDLLADCERTTFALDWAATFDDAREAITRNGHDLYLIDYRLGERNGLELLRHARAARVTAPMILLTGQGDGDIDLAAMKEGAADYLIKGRIDASLLERSIRYALEQSRTLRALQESEDRYALSARGANDGLWVWDLAVNEVYYSPRWKSMLGYSDGDIGNMPDDWFSRVHSDDVELLRNTIDVHVRGWSPHFENEHRMRCADGTYRWMLTRGLAVRDETGAATRIGGSQTDVTERRLAVERLTYDAFHDALTQLPNRALFMDRLERAMETLRRHPDALFAVLFLDLDRFKVVNDSLGHFLGDELLIAVARRLNSIIRSSDTVARLGGDEFGMLIEEIDQETAAVRTAQRVQDALSLPFEVGGHEIFTTVSIGIALSTSGYQRAHDVLRDADIAMYRAKSRGKARHELFDTAMHERALKRLQFETDLRRAIERGELRVHYQPIVSMLSGKLLGFEALVRWQHGDKLISAEEIVAVAEETGLIVPIGEWVLREALRQMRAWGSLNGHSATALDIHVNLSARQLLHPSLLERVSDALSESGIDPRRLQLEVTESVLIDSAETAAALLRELRDVQVGLSLDDFGTGYSSLSSLRQFPFNSLKIDRTFLHDADAHRADAIVRTIAALARSLGMEVTVEGLETLEQVDRMRELGIDRAQGFYFSPPLPPEEAVSLIVRR